MSTTSEAAFWDWWTENHWTMDPYEATRVRYAFEAGYAQRSSEVAEDLRLFNNLMGYVDTEH